MRYLIKTVAAVALVAALASTPVVPARADVFADFKAARAAKNAGNFDTAIRLYTRVIQSGKLSGKNLAVTYNNRGNAYSEKREYDRAIADFNRAIELQPNYANAYLNRGLVRHSKRQYDRAIADFNKALEFRPNYAIAFYGRGNAYDSKRQYDRAIADYNRAIGIKPGYVDAYYNRGRAHEKNGRRDLAIADYRKGRQLAPNDPGFVKALKRLGVAP